MSRKGPSNLRAHGILVMASFLGFGLNASKKCLACPGICHGAHCGHGKAALTADSCGSRRLDGWGLGPEPAERGPCERLPQRHPQAPALPGGTLPTGWWRASHRSCAAGCVSTSSTSTSSGLADTQSMVQFPTSLQQPPVMSACMLMLQQLAASGSQCMLHQKCRRLWAPLSAVVPTF